MIEIIKGLFKVGDRIILVCSDGEKREGTILNITDDVILLRDNNNLVKGVKSTLIEYFEQSEGSIEKGKNSLEKEKHELKIIDKIPLETLFQKDPRLQKRFPNLAKEQEERHTQVVSIAKPKQDTPYYMNNVDRLIRRTKIDEAITYINEILVNALISSKIKSALLLKKAQILSAQNRQSAAASAYEELIELNKKIGSASNNISHLYTELARLQLLNAETTDKASESISMALKYNKNNDAARNLLVKIGKEEKLCAEAPEQIGYASWQLHYFPHIVAVKKEKLKLLLIMQMLRIGQSEKK